MRRQKKLIDKISVDGKEVCDKDEIKKHLLKHFKQLYKKQDLSTFDISGSGLHKLSQANSLHEELVTTQEIE